MVSLESVLGHGLVAARLTELLKEHTGVRLSGPSGSGKSHIAREVAQRWELAGGTVVIATGDFGHVSRPFHPLATAQLDHPGGAVDLVAGSAKAALGAATASQGLGTTGASVFELLASGRRKRSERALERFSRVERDWLLLFKRISAKGDCLLVVENAHWWDLQAAQLVAALTNEELRERLPGLEKLRVLVVDTDLASQPAGDPTARDLLIGLASVGERIELCDAATFPLVLRALGVTEPLPDQLIETLYSATSGHLRLASAISTAIRAGEPLLDDGGAVRRLLADKLTQLAADDPELSDLIARAAVLGSRFQERELLCITERTRPAELRDSITRAIEAGLFGKDRSTLGFAHESIWQAVSEHSASPATSLFAKLADCLALLRSGDYASRALAHAMAGEDERSKDYYALAAVGRIREGADLLSVLPGLPDEVAGDSVLVNALECLADAYRAIGEGDFARATRALRPQPPTALLGAERAYAQAICAMELQTADGVAEADAVLNEWLSAVQAEPELHSRFLVLRIQVEVLAERFDDARQTELAVERLLTERTAYDPAAHRTLQIQNRRSASTRVPEIARLNVLDAVDHFRRATSSGRPESIELYRSLTNLAAVELRLGKDAQALDHINEAERIALELGGTAPRMDVLGNNAAIAGLRAGAYGPAAASERQSAVATAAREAGDGFLQQCNLAGFHLLASQDAEARSLLAELRNELDAHGYSETYLRYYLGALEVAYLHLTGDTNAALRAHDALGAFVVSLRWPCASYVRRRHDLLVAQLQGLPVGDRLVADRLLLSTRPYEIGEAWSYYARLIPLCELSFWSDS